MKYLNLLPFVMLAPIPAAAQEDDIVLIHPVRETVITVVASGNRDAIYTIGQPVSVIGAEEIAAIQGPDVTRAIERVPGVVLSRNGGLGAFTGVRLRGADAEQVLVTLDGVRMADVAAPGGGFDFGTLVSGGIGRIDLLRGSNSLAWGSDAIGGVVALTSREIDGAEASAEYGAHDSFDGQVNAGLAQEWGQFAMSAGHTRSDGISAAAVGDEPDGMSQWRLGARGRLALSSAFALVATARYARTRTDIDGFPPPNFTFADTPEFQRTRQFSGRTGFEAQLATLTLSGGFALSGTRRAYFDPTFDNEPNYITRGRSERAELRGRWQASESWRIDFGADHDWQRFSSSFDAQKRARTAAGHAQLAWSRDGTKLAAGVRLDDHSRFGSEWTYGANASQDIGDRIRLRASYGEGFKAPTLFQLFSDFGNAALSPERSRSFDAGIEMGDRNNGALHLALTVFRRDSRNLIDFVSCFGTTTGICANRPFGTYDNIGRARAQGIEAEADAVLGEVTLRAAYTCVTAVNRTPGHANRGNDLARRPRHALTLGADWETPLAGLKLGGDVRVVSKSFDDAGNFVRIVGHALGTLRASLPLGDNIELFGRVENLWDEDYETAAGYGTAGRSAFFGARARW